MQNLSYENEFDLQVNGLVSKTDFHMNGFALGLILKQWQRELGNGPLKKAKQQSEGEVFNKHASKLLNVFIIITIIIQLAFRHKSSTISNSFLAAAFFGSIFCSSSKSLAAESYCHSACESETY